MRIPIAYEGVPTQDGRLLLDGALDLPASVPVTIGPDHRQVGVATRLERTADGAIWATINLSPAIEIGPTTWIDVDTADGSSTLVSVTGATLRTIHLGPSAHRVWRNL